MRVHFERSHSCVYIHFLLRNHPRCHLMSSLNRAFALSSTCERKWEKKANSDWQQEKQRVGLITLIMTSVDYLKPPRCNSCTPTKLPIPHGRLQLSLLERQAFLRLVCRGLLREMQDEGSGGPHFCCVKGRQRETSHSLFSFWSSSSGMLREEELMSDAQGMCSLRTTHHRWLYSTEITWAMSWQSLFSGIQVLIKSYST